MNFQEAITAHTQWKMKLASYIAKPDHSLNASELGMDNKCLLGQWLHGEGHKHSSLPEFSTPRIRSRPLSQSRKRGGQES